MENTEKKVKEHRSKWSESEIEEAKEINKQLQEARRVEQQLTNEVTKLPSAFRLMRSFRRRRNSSMNPLKEIETEFENLVSSGRVKLGFPLSFFDLLKLNCSNVKKTRRNLRFSLKSNPKITRIDFTPMGAIIDGKIISFLEGSYDVNFMPVGKAVTSQVYANPIVQTFFEFSLYYSYEKQIELSPKKAKIIFDKVYNAALDVTSKDNEEIKLFKDFIAFLYKSNPFFDFSTLPTYKTGRPKGQDDDTKKILELAKQGFRNTEISEKLKPNLEDRARKSDVLRIGVMTRRAGLHARHRKK